MTPVFRILHAVAPGRIGGLESVVRLLAAGQVARGDAVAVGCVLEPGAESPLASALEERGVSVHRLVIPPRRYLTERRRWRELIRAFGPDVVHTHGYRPDILAGSAARSLSIPVAATVHGFTGGGWKNRFYERLQRGAFRRADAVVAVSAPLVKLLEHEGVPSRRIHRIPNAWAPTAAPLGRAAARQVLGLGADELVVGWVGRLGAEKAPDVLVRALEELRDLPIRVSFVGSGRQGEAVQSLAARLGVADRIHWHGAVDDAGRLMAAFDVFVLSSRTEGTPMVLFEAMAARVPVVSTSVGGVPDVIGPAQGLLVPADAPAALAGAIRSVLADPAAAGERARSAAERLEREYAMEPWLERHAELYGSLRDSTDTAGNR